MHERIKKLRKALGLTQQEFASRLNIGRGTLANYEVGRNEPIDAVITLICQTFNVNEDWLRNGNGPMFIARDPEDELEAAIRRIASGKSEDFKRRFVTALAGLEEEHWELLEQKMREILCGRSTPAPAGASTEIETAPRPSLSDSEALYENSLDSARNTGLSVSNTTGDTGAAV